MAFSLCSIGCPFSNRDDGLKPLYNLNTVANAPRALRRITACCGWPHCRLRSPPHNWKAVQDLIAAAKAKPRSLSYGTGGSGTGTHMNAERFRLRAGIDAVQVPYKGSPEALVDVIAGRIDWSFLPVSTALAYT